MSNNKETAEAYNEGAEWYHAHVSDPSDSVYHAYYEKPAIRAELPNLDGLEVISLGCGRSNRAGIAMGRASSQHLRLAIDFES